MWVQKLLFNTLSVQLYHQKVEMFYHIAFLFFMMKHFLLGLNNLLEELTEIRETHLPVYCIGYGIQMNNQMKRYLQ